MRGESSSGRTVTMGILRSTVLMGAAGVIRSLGAVARLKVFALLLGPSGIGLLGVLQSITSTMVTLADFGLGAAATRELARVTGKPQDAARVRRAALTLALALGVAAGGLLWVLRRPVATLVVGDPRQAWMVGILALAVPLSSVAGVLLGLLAADRRVGSNALARIAAAVAGTVLAIAIAARFGLAGLPWTIVALMACLVVAAGFYGRDLVFPGVGPVRATRRDLRALRTLLTVGAAATMATVSTAGMDLAVRAYWTRRWDLDTTGEYQAAWSVSMLVTGLTLAALAVDYFPAASSQRLVGAELASLFRGQVVFSLRCAAPAVLAIVAFPAVLTQLLYTPDFAITPVILRWQAVGDLLRLVFWIQATTLLAGGRIRAYVSTQLSWNALYLGCLVLLVERWGPPAAGGALALSYLPLVAVQAFFLRRGLAAGALAPGLRLLAGLVLASATCAALHQWTPRAVWLADSLAAAVAAYCLWRLWESLRARSIGDD